MGRNIHRALIVDDESQIREATSRALSDHSFCCETASEGSEALEIHRETRHDLVVTDLRMPDFHGHSLILELLKEKSPPSIVVLTGVASPPLVKELLGRGVSDVIHKPVDFQFFAMKMLTLAERSSWGSKLGESRKLQLVDNNDPLIFRTERDLELYSICIPPELERQLSAENENLRELPENMVHFYERLSRQRQNPVERRRTDRVPILSSAIAIPVNKDFIPQGDATQVTFYDLSSEGACLLHTRRFESDYLAIQWRSLVSPKRFLMAVLNIKRCRPLGPIYEIAGPFVMHD